MSGVAGGNRILRGDVQATFNKYVEEVLQNIPGFKKASLSGSVKAGSKADFGDLDIIVWFEGDDKREVKQRLIDAALALPQDIIVPFKSEKYTGRRYYNSGELISVLYPIVGQEDQYIQVDNIIALTEEEHAFKGSFLDLPAEKQGLLIGLAKVILLEQDPQDVFRRMGISNVPELAEGEEFEFNLSSVKLSLRKVKLENFREVAREEVWSTTAWGTIKILFQGFNIDGSFEDLLDDVARKLTNARSKNRIAGIFKSMVSVKSGEVGTAKGKGKEDALEKVAQTLAEALDDGSEVVALYAGGFKPPHLAHFENAKFLSTKADKIVIFIGPKIREGVKITAEQSKAIWEIYAKYINVPMEIVISKVTPILDTYEWIDANQDKVTNIITGAMADEMKKFAGIEKKKQNGEYKNVEVKELPVITNKEDDKFSATDIRKSEKFLLAGKWIPKVVSKEDKQAIVDLIAPQQEDSIEDKMLTAVDTVFENFFPKKDTKEVVKEGSSGTPIQPSGAIPSKDREDLIELFNQLRSTIDSDKYTVVFEQDRIGVYIKTYADVSFDQTPLQKRLPEGAEQEKFDYTPYIGSLLEYMLDQKMNITPLPEVKIRYDENQANDFFGKTAYYDPNNQEVVLYVMGRHPKDVCRSFSHEMIHHMQNMEGRLQGLAGTTNTNEDDVLQEIEKEAYLKGNITFRNWEDGLKNNNKKVMAEGRYDTVTNRVSSAIFNHWKKEVEEGMKTTSFSDFIESDDLSFDVQATLVLKPGTKKLKIDGGADYSPEGEYDDAIMVTFQIDPTMLPEFWEEISMNLKDVVRHEIEHLTHSDSDNLKTGKYIEDDQYIRDLVKLKLLKNREYFLLPKEVDANLQGMYLRAKKEKRPFADVVNTYLDAQKITSKEKEEILALWRKRLPALGIKQTL
ncbi:nicotinamide mononucleotide adenylyltransferase [Flavobacterium phage vB_FspM_immuto_3-5A]|uniref:Nicotinamide mononucleotide adenylyltransferase n=1 Tax=Flavobacterium phage vB_FspM_immuto_2-6A TaxID=2801477 RepID=A0A7T8IX07_9CAUD|nr:nicotinamide mononucleotide adenylyltransferase [Flavobacterium phage vB_FspM_immuto_2-6A]QQO91862.1 nicotinamide mononucleotide adenylyltransferase [Flavobacterium phage vB_FspM_immuto_2-6A]QQO92100.1 nicotinamide mononucleotide adenylyltransferase [Flavobacterium phage vB_FspM_immuto_3-5A]QQO92338.1 nicotinamide mononucleotide adenylyltransferase [Flavobacterium phage vB_FspM_immuto_13-6C]